MLDELVDDGEHNRVGRRLDGEGGARGEGEEDAGGEDEEERSGGQDVGPHFVSRPQKNPSGRLRPIEFPRGTTSAPWSGATASERFRNSRLQRPRSSETPSDPRGEGPGSAPLTKTRAPDPPRSRPCTCLDPRDIRPPGNTTGRQHIQSQREPAVDQPRARRVQGLRR